MIQTQNVSVVLCGFATAPGCYEAAKDSNIPYIITASYAAFPGMYIKTKENRYQKG